MAPDRPPTIDTILAAHAPLRDKALLALMLGIELRPFQIAALDRGDVHEKHGGAMVLRVRGSPTQPEQTIPLPPKVACLLRSYLGATAAEPGADAPLFFTPGRHAGTPRRRLSGRAIDCLAHRCARICGVDYPAPATSTPPLIAARLHAHISLHRGAYDPGG
jgi:integrase